VEEAVMAEFDRITERGGVLGAMETMYQRSRIQEESLYYETLKHTGEYPIIGVNTFLAKDGSPTRIPGEVIRATEEEKALQLQNLRSLHTAEAHRASDALQSLQATAVEGGLFGRTVLVSCGGQVMPLSLDTPVVPYVRDSLLAAAVGSRYGLSLEHAVRGIESAGRVPGRTERIDRGQDAALFVDSPTSGHALAATLASLRRLTRGRLVVIAEEPLVERIGGRCFGPLVARHCDASIVVPTTVLADDPGDADIAAYARIDRTLESLGPDDCGLVLGGVGRPTTRPPAPVGRFPLAMLVDAWLQISQAPAAPGRQAA
jgi:hypothetical protein